MNKIKKIPLIRNENLLGRDETVFNQPLYFFHYIYGRDFRQSYTTYVRQKLLKTMLIRFNAFKKITGYIYGYIQGFCFLREFKIYTGCIVSGLVF